MGFADSVATQRGAWALLATFVLAFAMSPRALVVKSGVLRIERRLWPARAARGRRERRADRRLWPLVITPDDVGGAIAAIDPRPALGAYRSEPGESS